jgi:hypothetical protein
MESDMSEWQPIETAPKDGTSILVIYEGGQMIVSYWRVTESTTNGTVDYHMERWVTPWMAKPGVEPAPTHWQPLPDLPK